MTFHIPFRTTLFKSFSTTNPLLELENLKGISVEADRESDFPFR